MKCDSSSFQIKLKPMRLFITKLFTFSMFIIILVIYIQ